MPYPHFHAFRILPPERFESYAAKKKPNGILMIFGIKNGKAYLQAIRFQKDKWTFAEAKAWIRKHGYKPILEEPASEK